MNRGRLPWDFSPMAPYLSPDGDGEGGGTEGAEGKQGEGGNGTGEGKGGDGKPAGVQFSAEQEAELNRRLAAARKDGEKSGRKSAEDALNESQRQAEDKRKQDEAVARGEFDKVRGDLERERDAIAADRDDYKKRYEDAVAQVKPGVDAKWATLPAEVTRLYRGADDDPIAKASFLAESEDIVKALSGSTGNGTVRVPLTPRPTGKETPEVTSLVNTKNF